MVKKFVKLCSKCNPNIIELLGVNDDCIVQIDDIGKYLRENSEIFLSKRVISSYGNYSNAQLRRLENALCHDSFEEKQRLIHIKNSLDSQIEEFNKKYNLSSRDSIDIFIDKKMRNYV